MYTRDFFKVLLTMIALVACGQLTNTIYVPDMKIMADQLNVRSGLIQEVMAIYVLAYGFSQLFYGPISDIKGRKPCMLFGVGIFIVGCFIAAVTRSFTVLLIASLIQGLGTGVGGVMCRTVMRDCYLDVQLQKANSTMSIALILSPLMAPLIGGYLGTAFGWHAVFWFLGFFGMFVWGIIFYLFKETHKKDQLNTGLIKKKNHFYHQFLEIMNNPVFVKYLAILVFAFAGIAIFEASSGIIMGKLMGVSPQTISILFVLPLPAYLFGSWASSVLVNRFSMKSIVMIGFFVMTIGSINMLIPAMQHKLNLWVLLAPAGIYFVGCGLIFPTCTTMAMSSISKNLGTAGALLGGIQNLGGGMITLLYSNVTMSSQLPLATTLMAVSLLIGIILQFPQKRYKSAKCS